MKDNDNGALMVVVVALTVLGIMATAASTFVLVNKNEGLERRLSTVIERADKLERALDAANAKLETFDAKIAGVGSKAESAARGSDMVLNAVSSIGREMDKRK